MAYRVPHRGTLLAIFAGVLLIVGCEAYLLWQIREERWRSAVMSAQNVLRTLESAIDRNLGIVELSLSGVQDAVQERDLSALDPSMRNMLLFDRAANAEYLGSMLVLSPNGDIRFDSASPTPRAGNFQDRDYFRAHLDRHGVTFVSRPYESRLRDGDPSIVLSRRITQPDGSFGGIVMGAVRLAFFHNLFAQLRLGPGDVIALVSFDGHIIMRTPSLNGRGDIGLDLSGSAIFQRFLRGPVSYFSARATIDGVERYYVYERVGNYPLVLVVGISSADVLAEWREQAIGFGVLGVGIACMLLGLAIALQRALSRERKLKAEMEVLATTDPLTGLANRRHFESMLTLEWHRAARTRLPLSLLVIDVDHFKQVNDRHGHTTGDRVLVEVARRIAGVLKRPGDLAARYGGEEFAALLPNADRTGARDVAEQIRLAMQASPFQGDASGPISITVSIGISTMDAVHEGGVALNDLFRRADRALYKAKDSGRNMAVALDTL